MSLAATVKAMAAAGMSANAVARAVSRLEEAKRRRGRFIYGLPRAEWFALRQEIFARDGARCAYCGSDGEGWPLEIDHIQPRSRGGRSEPNNLTVACKPCNSSKRDRTPEEWSSACQ